MATQPILCSTGAETWGGVCAENAPGMTDQIAAAFKTLEQVNPAAAMVVSVERWQVVDAFITHHLAMLAGTPFNREPEYDFFQMIELRNVLEAEINKVLPTEYYYGSHPWNTNVLGIWRRNGEPR